jgi:hypothetical protein
MHAAPVNLPSQANPKPLREQLTVLADAVHRAFGPAAVSAQIPSAPPTALVGSVLGSGAV